MSIIVSISDKGEVRGEGILAYRVHGGVLQGLKAMLVYGNEAETGCETPLDLFGEGENPAWEFGDRSAFHTGWSGEGPIVFPLETSSPSQPAAALSASEREMLTSADSAATISTKNTP